MTKQMPRIPQLHNRPGLFVAAIFLVSTGATLAQPAMKDGLWKMTIKSELIDKKTGKRKLAKDDTNIELCYTRRLLDTMTLLRPTLQEQISDKGSLKLAACRMAVNQMGAAGMTMSIVCGLPDSQRAEINFNFEATESSYRSKTIANRTDGTEDVEGTIIGKYMGECQSDSLGADLPISSNPPTLPLTKPQPILVDGDSFYFSELSDAAGVAFENAYVMRGETVSRYTKYFSAIRYQRVSFNSLLKQQIEHSKSILAKGAAQPELVDLDDGKKGLFFVANGKRSQTVEAYFMLFEPHGDSARMLNYVVVLRGNPVSNKSQLASMRAKMFNELQQLSVSHYSHADFSAARP